MDRPSEVDQVVAAVLQSKRYRDIDDSVVRRCAAQALVAARHRVPDAVKRAKRQLHQVYGAYVGLPPRYERLLTRVRDAHAEGGEAFRGELRQIMLLHASTRERVPHLDEFYGCLFDRIGPVSSVIDVGCGLNPLAAPWMQLTPGAVYTPVDIDRALVAFVGACLELMPLAGEPTVVDAVAHPPAQRAELALVLKMVPCLEQQQRGAGAALINALQARRVAVSFPIRSLGGRGKGMETNYARAFEAMARDERWTVERVEAPGELLYLIAR